MTRKTVLHPYFFSLYAVLGVYAQNANEIPPLQLIRPLLVATGFFALIFYLLNRLLKDLHRAGLLTTLLIFWGVYFGHIYRFLNYFAAIRALPDERTLILIGWTLAVSIFALPQIWKHIHHPSLVTQALNITSLAVMAIPTITLVFVVSETVHQADIMKSREAAIPFEPLKSAEDSPDIYYIIVDGYGREDILGNIFGYDNREFIGYLENKGFQVAGASQSNYMQTQLSVSSSLNFDYLDDLQTDLGRSANRGPLTELTNHSRARRLLEKAGYQFVNVESIALFMSISDADVYLRPQLSGISKFESLLITTSVADVLIEEWFPDFPLLNYETHRRHLLYQFEALKDTVEIPGKKFVFVHFWAPHPPFVFDETGNPIQPDTPYSPGDATGFIGTEQEYFSGYSGETSYVNSQLKVIIEGILSRSKQPPIIIIQGDHGPGIHTSFLKAEDTCLQERFSILNAYYFPDGDYSTVAESVTPVNSFRIIFNKYFGAELPLLKDKHYYSTWLRPYQFTEVTGKTDLQCTFKP